MLGLGLALVSSERFDRRLWNRDELEESFGLPVLGTIPDSKALAGNGRSEELPPLESEAFRMLRGRLRYFDVDRKVSSVLVTSGAARDGKSTVAWNLALTAASVGSKTILLECDFHQPSLAARHSLRPVPGLSELLTGQTDLVVQHVSVANSSNGEEPDRQLDVVVAGTRPPNPLELMESDEMAALIAHLTQRIRPGRHRHAARNAGLRCDPAAEARQWRDRGGRARANQARVSHRRFASSSRAWMRRCLGVVVNKVRTRSGYGHGYYHQDEVAGLRIGDRA